MTRPVLVVFDGLDGSGKSTQIDLLEALLQARNVHYVRTREPGGCPEAEAIRERLLSEEGKKMSSREQFDLFWRARQLHIDQTILPALTDGNVVLCDRFDSSTLAFQIFGNENYELESEFFRRRREIVIASLGHDVYYIVFDLTPKIARRRMAVDQTRRKTHFDLRPLSYHERVREGFAHFQQKVGASHVAMVDASFPSDVVHRAVLAHFNRFTQR